MRVLQVVQKPQRRGAEMFAFDLSDELRRHGVTTRTAYLYPFTGPGALELQPGDLVLDGNENHPIERLLAANFALLGRLRRAIDEFQPDVVQVNGSRAVKYGALARRLSGAPGGPPWVLIYRNIGDPGSWVTTGSRRIFYQRFVMPTVDGVVAVSAATLETVRRFYPLTVPLVTIPRGVASRAFLPSRTRDEVRQDMGTDPDVPVVVFVGSLTAEKRPDRLVRVFSEVARYRRGARLWVVGDGDLRRATEAQVAAQGLQANVTFTGVCDRVQDLLHAADVLLLTSDTEGIPGVILEAGAAGLPTVATNVGGTSECVVNGTTGFLANADDEQALTDGVLMLFGDEFLRKKLGTEAQRLVKESFSIDSVAAEYLHFYEHIRAGAPRASAQARGAGRALASAASRSSFIARP